jgi:hypothetical protein
VQTVLAPFIIISEDDTLAVSGQFRMFWAIAGPITFLVVLSWALWTQRSEISKILPNRRPKTVSAPDPGEKELG